MEGGRAKGKELDMARSLIEAMSGPWRPEDFRDTYTERVEKLVAAKRNGNEIVTEAEPSSPTEAVDLMEALRRSMDRHASGSSGKAGAGRRHPDLIRSTARPRGKRSTGCAHLLPSAVLTSAS